MAMRLTMEAAASSAESNRLDSRLTDPVSRKAPNLSTIRSSAAPTDAKLASRINRA
jgi:hypothetical protein